MPEFDLVYRLLDEELVDADERRCGRVDDLEFDGTPGKPAKLVALLSGPGAWRERFPRRLRGHARRVFNESTVAIPWKEVDSVAETVALKRAGEELGLGRGDDEAGIFIRRLPGSG